MQAPFFLLLSVLLPVGIICFTGPQAIPRSGTRATQLSTIENNKSNIDGDSIANAIPTTIIANVPNSTKNSAKPSRRSRIKNKIKSGMKKVIKRPKWPFGNDRYHKVKIPRSYPFSNEEESGVATLPTASLNPSTPTKPYSTTLFPDFNGMTFPSFTEDLEPPTPPSLDSQQCLVPGEAVVRVETAPSNSRRIFAGIDIYSSVDTVWKLLTDYDKLQDVIPNLVKNEVVARYDGISSINDGAEDDIQHLKQHSPEIQLTKKGARLSQIGGAKVFGIDFSARTTLDVREWPQGLPDFMHEPEYTIKVSPEELPLTRHVFPRPFCIGGLPSRDITMQSIKDDGGEFRIYQGKQDQRIV